MKNHLNAFQRIVNQLATMKMVMDDEMQASLLLCSLPDNWETFVMIISNYILNGALSMDLVKINFFNEETRRKAYDTKKMKWPSSHKVEEEIRIEDRKAMTSPREGLNPKIKSNVSIVKKKGI